jgi:hypothetical protein
MFGISTYSRLLKSIVFTMLVARLAAAQVPAGPNRPAAVPAVYVITPFGYFHPSCVNHLAEGDVLLQDEKAIQHANGTYDTIPAFASKCSSIPAAMRAYRFMRWLGAPDSFTSLQTLALDIPCLSVTCRKDKPERRSRTTASRSTSKYARPIRRPPSFARRIPASTRSMMRFPFEFCNGPTITTIARPSGPPESMFRGSRQTQSQGDSVHPTPRENAVHCGPLCRTRRRARHRIFVVEQRLSVDRVRGACISRLKSHRCIHGRLQGSAHVGAHLSSQSAN